MAAFQGGMLLSQAAQDVTPPRDALDAAIDHVASFAARPRRHGAGHAGTDRN